MDIKKNDTIQYVNRDGSVGWSLACADLQPGADRIEVALTAWPDVSYDVTYHVQLTAIISVQRVIPGEGTVTVYDANAPK